MFLTPAQIVSECKFSPGIRVADFGAGSGAIAFEIAKKVSPNGKVYAIEVQKDLITRMKNDAPKSVASSIEYIWGDIEKLRGTKLADRSVDFSVLSNVLFQVEDRKTFIEEVLRVTKAGGKIFLVDWSESFGGMGPSIDHVVSQKDAISMFEAKGCVVESEVAGGDHHYGIIFIKKA
jgi:ubiquinone/menaquinone biosynthesis C-methylase UbiE